MLRQAEEELVDVAEMADAAFMVDGDEGAQRLFPFDDRFRPPSAIIDFKGLFDAIVRQFSLRYGCNQGR